MAEGVKTCQEFNNFQIVYNRNPINHDVITAMPTLEADFCDKLQLLFIVYPVKIKV